LEAVELARPESARVALVLRGAGGFQPAALVELPPVADGAGTDAEEGGDLLGGASLAQPQQGGEAVVKAGVFLQAASFSRFFRAGVSRVKPAVVVVLVCSLVRSFLGQAATLLRNTQTMAVH
jgi:hypothetical protein